MQFKLSFDTKDMTTEIKALLPLENHSAGIFCIAPECNPNFKKILDATPD